MRIPNKEKRDLIWGQKLCHDWWLVSGNTRFHYGSELKCWPNMGKFRCFRQEERTGIAFIPFPHTHCMCKSGMNGSPHPSPTLAHQQAEERKVGWERVIKVGGKNGMEAGLQGRWKRYQVVLMTMQQEFYFWKILCISWESLNSTNKNM